jgi:nicotinic acid mononucleotide adenylyltransferase
MMVRPPYRLEDPADLRALRRLVRETTGAPRPAARWVRPLAQPSRWLAALAGTFNPPTQAHLALLEAARAAGADAVTFVVAVVSIEKEQLSAALLEDRLALLDQIAARLEAGLVLTNAGLYAEQAAALRTLLPTATRLSFILGADKVLQIFDPRYYHDRDAALEQLFAQADLLVVPRAELESEAIARFLATPPAARWRHAVTLLSPPASLDRWLSASAVRRGEVTSLEQALPPESVRFLEQWQPYQPGSYERRRALLDQLEREGTSASGAPAPGSEPAS